MKRVVITGIGICGASGGRDKTWEAVKNGSSPACRFSRNGHEYIGARIPYNGGVSLQVILSESLKEAVSDSGLELRSLKSQKPLSTISVSKPDFTTYIHSGSFEKIYNCYGPLKVFEGLGIECEKQVYSAACSTGLVSVINAYKAVKNGVAGIAFAGAGETPFNPLYYNGFKNMAVLAADTGGSPSGIMKPFSKNRSGFIMGEGGCVLVLEDMDSALKRGAKIYAEVSAGETGFDADALYSFKDNTPVISALIKKAAEAGRVSADKGVYIHSHGTATRSNDIIETKSIKDVFGRMPGCIKVSSTKPVTGHMLGAAGAAGSALAALALKEQYLPPTINLEEPDELCDLDYVANKGYNWECESALVISAGFGGHTGVVALKKAV